MDKTLKQLAKDFDNFCKENNLEKGKAGWLMGCAMKYHKQALDLANVSGSLPDSHDDMIKFADFARRFPDKNEVPAEQILQMWKDEFWKELENSGLDEPFDGQ